MRILIFSDLHANLAALLALQLVEPEPEALFFLGDAVGYGPDPAACVGWLMSNASVAVHGDHDLAAAAGADPQSPPDWLEIARATCAAHRAILSDRPRDYLKNLPAQASVELGGARFFLTHRAPAIADALTASEAAISTVFEGTPADVILIGHTHIPLLRRVGNTWLVNPGSLGQPRHGVPSATYAIWQDGDLRIHHIDYDPRPTIRKLALLALDPEHLVRLQDALTSGI